MVLACGGSGTPSAATSQQLEEEEIEEEAVRKPEELMKANTEGTEWCVTLEDFQITPVS
jgi:hypothetical protein